MVLKFLPKKLYPSIFNTNYKDRSTHHAVGFFSSQQDNKLKNSWPVTRVLLSQVKLCQTEWLYGSCHKTKHYWLLISCVATKHLVILATVCWSKIHGRKWYGLIKIQPGIKRVIIRPLTQGELYDIVLQSNDSYYHENRV